MDKSLESICDDSLSRAATYALLARLFREEIDENLLLELKKQKFNTAELNETSCMGAKLMDAYLETADDKSKTELAVDYARLFLIREKNTQVAAYPFESVYTSEKKTVMGNARDSAMKLYRDHGFKMDDKCRLAEDHIAIELEFEKELSLRIAKSEHDDGQSQTLGLINDQEVFLDQHLLNWVPTLAQVMSDIARTDFYKGLAWYTLGFLQNDKVYLNMLNTEESV